MHVRRRVAGQVEVEHQVDRGYVEAARGDVRGDEDVARVGFEFVERGEARGLRELAVERDRAEAEGAKEVR